MSYTTSDNPGRLSLRLTATELSGDHMIGFQYFFGDKLKGRSSELESFDKLIIRAKTGNEQPVQMKVTLTTADAISFQYLLRLPTLSGI